ncbi:MAG: hypothetical protein IKO44_00615 [Ruminococcus sp.]|nr:hypothetical protein [Ruminococcus sp.]
MKTLLLNYEEQLRLIEKRLEELRQLKKDYIPVPALNLLRARIDTLITEKYELMSAIVMIRKYLEPKDPDDGRSGDAA